MIVDVIKATPTQLLPALSHIPPPKRRLMNALTNDYKKIMDNRNLPIHQVIDDANRNRLCFRRPLTKTPERALEDKFNLTSTWTPDWTEHVSNNMQCIKQKTAGFRPAKQYMVYAEQN